jgi:glycosyltransferase involved in cell wall biosynthesis/peptidoglycan/xylan/chitin deacetylase (PgdA/CDA1 family)
MRKIAVLFFIDRFVTFAGAEKNLFDVMTGLDKKRYRPILLCIHRGDLAQVLVQKGIEAKDLRIKRIYSFHAFIKAIAIFKFIKKNNIKIIVTYHESSDFFGSIIGKLSGVPVIISSRRDMGFNLKKRHILFYKLINPLFDMVLTVSDAVKNEIFSKQNILWHKCVTLYNGVKISDFPQDIDKGIVKKSLGLDNNRPVVGILAGIRPIKGHKYFLEAASLILKEYPETYFLIVGWPDDKIYYKQLKDLTKQLKIGERVLFVGGRSDTAKILSITDISVLSSLSEGFSNAVIESMAAGKPVVATNVGGTTEAVVDGETGFLVPPYNAKALADAILRLLRNKKMAEDMGKKGRRLAEEKFSLNIMIEQLQHLYESLLSIKDINAKQRTVLDPYLKISYFKRAVKTPLYGFLFYSSITSLINSSNGNNRAIKILAYHRVNNDKFNPLGMSINVANFEKHMRLISRDYNPVSLENAIELLTNKQKIPKNCIVVTFDDGYKDNYIHAFPIIKKYNIPATIFLSVEAINKQNLLWYDAIVNAFQVTTKDSVNLQDLGLGKYDLSLAADKITAINAAVSFGKYIRTNYREVFIKELLMKLDAKLKTNDKFSFMLDWGDIKLMQKNGISFGSHGMTHSILTTLSNEEVEYEIRESKEIMQKEIGTEINLFSYPNGGERDFNSNIERVLRENNYLSACSLIKGTNKNNTPLFSLRRYCVNSGLISGFLGGFSRSIFEVNTVN